jgi:hypothetical protein
MPPIGPNAATAPDESIDPERDTNGQAAHSFGQGSLVARLDDEVQMIPLYREMKDPEAPWIALGSASQGDTERRKDVLTT